MRLSSLHFYHSDRHRTTNRYRDQKNPEVFGAIRYLTKLFQFESSPSPESLSAVQSFIDAFEPKRDIQSAYAQVWIEKSVPKLVQHAVNMEQALDFIEKTGLRKKISTISPPDQKGSAGWWLNKAPLRSNALALGPERTAADLGITVVAHETSDYLAYESITRSPTGAPNVLISRPYMPHESAAGGPGFYTAIGRKGAKNTGLTIRFEVDPRARLGVDFLIRGDPPESGQKASVGTHIIWLNKNAIRVIPESLNLGPVEYFKFLAESTTLSQDDRGIMERLEKRASHRLRDLDPDELSQILEIGRTVLQRSQGTAYAFLHEFFKIPGAQQLIDFAHLHQQMTKAAAADEIPVSTIMLWAHSKEIQSNPVLFREGFDRIRSIGSPEAMKMFISKVLSTWDPGVSRDQIRYVFETLRPSMIDELVKFVMIHPQFRTDELLRLAVDRCLPGETPVLLATHVFSQPDAQGHPDLFLKLLFKANDYENIIGIWGYARVTSVKSGANADDLKALNAAVPRIPVFSSSDHDDPKLWLREEIFSAWDDPQRIKAITAAIQPGSLPELLKNRADFKARVAREMPPHASGHSARSASALSAPKASNVSRALACVGKMLRNAIDWE